jgi:hypothetical protein
MCLELKMKNLCSGTTDGAPCMSEVNTGMAELVKQKVEAVGDNVHKLHCIIHQDVLCAKQLTLKELGRQYQRQ